MPRSNPFIGFPRFNSRPPGDQNLETFRQFTELQQFVDGLFDYIEDLENRIRPVFGSASVSPIPVINDQVNWVLLTLFDNTFPDFAEDPGSYQLILRLDVSGTTNNSWVQMRITEDGGFEEIGAQYDIGNNTRVSVTGSAIFPTGANLQFWIRGEHSELLSGRINVLRVGSGYYPDGFTPQHTA